MVRTIRAIIAHLVDRCATCTVIHYAINTWRGSSEMVSEPDLGADQFICRPQGQILQMMASTQKTQTYMGTAEGMYHVTGVKRGRSG